MSFADCRRVGRVVRDAGPLALPAARAAAEAAGADRGLHGLLQGNGANIGLACSLCSMPELRFDSSLCTCQFLVRVAGDDSGWFLCCFAGRCAALAAGLACVAVDCHQTDPIRLCCRLFIVTCRRTGAADRVGAALARAAQEHPAVFEPRRLGGFVPPLLLAVFWARSLRSVPPGMLCPMAASLVSFPLCPHLPGDCRRREIRARQRVSPSFQPFCIRTLLPVWLPSVTLTPCFKASRHVDRISAALSSWLPRCLIRSACSSLLQAVQIRARPARPVWRARRFGWYLLGLNGCLCSCSTSFACVLPVRTASDRCLSAPDLGLCARFVPSDSLCVAAPICCSCSRLSLNA